MDSPESLKFIEAWLKDPGTHIEDFIVPEGGFKSFNDFFTRRLNPARDPRPIAAAEDDSVLVASADSEINFILSDLTLTKKLDVKSRQLNITQLLNGSRYATNFEGGTAVTSASSRTFIAPTSSSRPRSTGTSPSSPLV
ncbi:phosphatidylserine decarboxylase [Sorangium sp. So ce426]|uniref:phosphatidylserine decarboxylase n=1 Tax=Sorangium sp. So ce426 TaxID=3133312 RepID=UPI003F5C7E3B